METPVRRCKIKTMFQELDNVRQIRGEGLRRWFIDDDLELILWYDADRKLEGFQILYDKLAGTRTITWKRVSSSDGETKSVLVSDGPFNKTRLISMMQRSAESLEGKLKDFILRRLEAHGG